MLAHLLHTLAPLTVSSLALGVVAVGISMMTIKEHSELWITRFAAIAFTTSCIVTFLVGSLLILEGTPSVSVVDIQVGLFGHHHLDLLLRLDLLSVPFVLVANLLCGTVGAFSRSYLHRDPGHHRFFFLTLLFALGMEIIFMAGTLEVLFVGWEFIGLTSALLISFFFERPSTADNALKAFWAYRISDSALLLCCILFGLAELDPVIVGAAHKMSLPSGYIGIAIPILIIIAALPKSAQFPFGSWLPRAMEGPTPSSAIFYGGLSVHAGLYLILRMQDAFLMPRWFFVAIGVIGSVSAIYGYSISRIQSDVKGSLAFSSMMHVGLMLLEVGVGLSGLAIVHFVGHAFLRTYQILNAGSLIHESRALVRRTSRRIRAPLRVPSRLVRWLYVLAFDLSLRNSSDPTSLVNRLERVSVRCARFDQFIGRFIGRSVEWLRSIFSFKVPELSAPQESPFVHKES